MKKLSILLVLLLSSFYISIIPVNADMGPKPSSEFVFINFPTQGLYFDLFVSKPETILPLSEDDWSEIDNYHYYTDFPRIQEGYVDGDEYSSFTLYTNLPHVLKDLGVDDEGNYHFKTGYLICPTFFKLVFYSEEGYVISSDIIERHEFNAVFTIDLTNIDFSYSHSFTTQYSETIQNDLTDDILTHPVLITDGSITNNSVETFIDFLFRITLTLCIEIIVLYFFQYSKRSTYLLVLFTNIMTQSLLTLVFLHFYDQLSLYLSYIPQLFLFETFVFAIEITIYYYGFKEKTKKNAVYYAVIANLITLFLTFILPMI